MVCPGGKSQCPQNQTCCQAASGSYVCCIYANVSTSCLLFAAILSFAYDCNVRGGVKQN